MSGVAPKAEATLHGRRVCVTGGAGFIGSHLVAALLSRGAQVCVIDNLSSGRRENLTAAGAVAPERLSLIEGDIRDPQALDAALPGCDTVFHLAALASVPASVANPEEAESINAAGSLALYAAARRHALRRVVVSSSSAVYGDDPVLPKHEGLAPSPESPYATSKLAMEHYGINALRLYGQEVAILRYFNVFGPRQDPASQYAAVIPIFTDCLLKGRQARIFGDGGQTRDFVYVDDVVRANLLAAQAPKAACGRPMNIAGGTGISVLHLYRAIAGLVASDLPPLHEEERPGDVRHSVADVTRAAQVLGFRAAVSLETGLAQTVDWFRNTHKEG